MSVTLNLHHLVLLTVMFASACELEPLNVRDLDCADTCGRGFQCIEGKCISDDAVVDAGSVSDAGSSDAGPVDVAVGVNLLSNAGFERVDDGGQPRSWSFYGMLSLERALDAGFSGSSARIVVQVPVDGGLPALTAPRLFVGAGMTLCTSILVRSDADAGLEVMLKTSQNVSGSATTAFSPGVAAVPSSGWSLVKERVNVAESGQLMFRLLVRKAPVAMTAFYVDDAWLSRTVDGGCP